MLSHLIFLLKFFRIPQYLGVFSWKCASSCHVDHLGFLELGLPYHVPLRSIKLSPSGFWKDSVLWWTHCRYRTPKRHTLITQGGLIDQRHANSNQTASFAPDPENRFLNDVSEASRMEAGRCTPFEGLRGPSCNWCLESDNHARSIATCWFWVSEKLELQPSRGDDRQLY